MTTIRKMGFLLLSVSAFIYLVTQSSSGQLWMAHTATLFTNNTQERQQQEAQKQAQKDAQEDAQEAKTPKQQDSSKQFERIKQLESQVVSLHDLAHAMRNNLADLQDKIDVLATKQSAAILPTTKESERADASVFELPINSTSRVSNTLNINARQDQRQSQLAHQARLQDVVQRMELTALKALTR